MELEEAFAADASEAAVSCQAVRCTKPKEEENLLDLERGGQRDVCVAPSAKVRKISKAQSRLFLLCTVQI